MSNNMKIKKILLSICLIFVFSIIFLCLSSYNIHFSGVIVENGIETAVNINLKNKRIDKLLNKMSGSIFIQIEDEKEAYEYNFNGPVFSPSDTSVKFISVYRFYKTQMENGYFYFDKNLKNIVLITSERQIYSADNEFLSLVAKFRN